MHFRRHCPGHAARDVILGPETVAADLISKIFQDRHAVPNHGIAIPQDRYLAG